MRQTDTDRPFDFENCEVSLDPKKDVVAAMLSICGECGDLPEADRGAQKIEFNIGERLRFHTPQLAAAHILQQMGCEVYLVAAETAVRL
jgi:hypothetical protein